MELTKRDLFEMTKLICQHTLTPFEFSFEDFKNILQGHCKCGSLRISLDLHNRELGYVKDNVFAVCDNCRSK